MTKIAGSEKIIILYKSESSMEHIIKYTDNFIVNSGEYLGFYSDKDIELSLNINNYSSYYTELSLVNYKEINVDVGYTGTSA
jgi:hypothetical protein